MMGDESSTIRAMYNRLYEAYGPQHWWPAKSKVEVVVGAILTQNTAWTNVERAISNLRRARALTWKALRDLTQSELATLIRPSGTYRIKARRLKTFVEVLWRDHNGSLAKMLSGELERVRRRLLAIPGIGPETADAILLYAGNRPVFVVDAYTQRVMRRHHLIDPGSSYPATQSIFHRVLEPDAALFNEYHALIVAVGKGHCRREAQCHGCPLERLPHDPLR